MMLGRPGTHQVQRAKFAPGGATHGLAVDGNVLYVEFLGEGPDPLLETVMKRAGIDAVKDAFKGVVRRHAIAEFDEAAKPIQTPFAKGLDLLPIFGPAQDGTQGHDDD